MNASPTLGKILLLCAAAVLVLSPSSSWSQDLVTLKDGSKRQGAIVGIDAQKNIRVQTQSASGVVTATVPLANVEAVSMNPPADLLAAEEAWQNGNAAAAVAKLDPLVNSFLGLPAPWVQRATLLLIDTLLDTGKTDEAEAILVKFQQAYPGNADSTALIRAKIAIARNNFIGARPLLAPIIEEAKQTNLADTTQSIKFGQAFFLMGQIRENEGDLPGALEDYLRSSTIFFADGATASKAQARADVLINDKNVFVP
jgi:hypothetical protein